MVNEAIRLIPELKYHEVEKLINKAITGGMISRIEPCQIALDEGAH